MAEKTITLVAGEPVAVAGVTLTLAHTGIRDQGGVSSAFAIVVVDDSSKA